MRLSLSPTIRQPKTTAVCLCQYVTFFSPPLMLLCMRCDINQSSAATSFAINSLRTSQFVSANCFSIIFIWPFEEGRIWASPNSQCTGIHRSTCVSIRLRTRNRPFTVSCRKISLLPIDNGSRSGTRIHKGQHETNRPISNRMRSGHTPLTKSLRMQCFCSIKNEHQTKNRKRKNNTANTI